MCGRYILNRKIDEVAEFFGAATPEISIHPASRFNIAPTQAAPVARLREGAPCLDALHWGLVPHWAPDTKGAARLINARSETVLEKRSFRDAMRSRRCLVPADGFYEWRPGDPAKVPHWIRPATGGLFAFAGIWSEWRVPNSDTRLETFSILTTSAQGCLGALHHRFAVVVPEALHRAWLDPQVAPETFSRIYHPPPVAQILVTPVNTRLNKATFEGPECLAPHVEKQLQLNVK